HGRAVTERDLPYVIAIDTDWDIQKTLFRTISTPIESKARLERWQQVWSDHGFGFWVFQDAAGKQVGHAGLFPSRHDPSWIEIGYVLKPPYWKLGYATELAMAILRIGFERLRMPRIVAVAHAENVASRRVMEKCGLSFDREFLYADKWPSVLYTAERDAWLAGH
ncbi:MAG: GNAT family N-acetyltransferase, partial [Candidatus Eremiobacteraeota bacterium]|nr:GNAT family N-acetyltransferase [Candidatus Eremiobacteraeota bacterium]